MSEVTGSKSTSLNDLKKQAQAYYGAGGYAHGVTDKIEDILNCMFYDKPVDIYGHLANYFDRFAKTPVISKIAAREALDSKGLPTLQADIYCKIKNEVKYITGAESSYMTPSELLKPEDKEIFDTERQRQVDASVELINETYNESLVDHDPTDQADIDKILSEWINVRQAEVNRKKEEEQAAAKAAEDAAEELNQNDPKNKKKGDDKSAPKSPKGGDKGQQGKGKSGGAFEFMPQEPLEEFYPGSSAVSVVSKAVCQAGALLSNVPLYQHISKAFKVSGVFQMPVPMTTVMSCGKLSPGKLNSISEFMLVPSPTMPLVRAAKYINKIYKHCAMALAGKNLPLLKVSNDVGALCASFEKAEQGLDLLQEAIKLQDLVVGVDFHIAIDCASNEMFDSSKGRYEVVAGKLLSPEELVVYWKDLLNSYPSIIAIIDPFRKTDKDAWTSLSAIVSSRCYVIGDTVYHRPGRLVNEELNDDVIKTSGVVLRFEHANSVTDVVNCARKMQETDNIVVMGSGAGETADSFLADLAVACSARFVKFGSMCRGERVGKLNRLIQIEAELRQKDRLMDTVAYSFPVIKQGAVSQPAQIDDRTAEAASPREQNKTQSKRVNVEK